MGTAEPPTLGLQLQIPNAQSDTQPGFYRCHSPKQGTQGLVEFGFRFGVDEGLKLKYTRNIKKHLCVMFT